MKTYKIKGYEETTIRKIKGERGQVLIGSIGDCSEVNLISWVSGYQLPNDTYCIINTDGTLSFVDNKESALELVKEIVD